MDKKDNIIFIFVVTDFFCVPEMILQNFKKIYSTPEKSRFTVSFIYNIWLIFSTIFYPPCQSLCTEPSEYDTVNGTNPGTGQHGGDRHWGGGEVDGHPVTFLYAMLLKHVGDSVNHL